MSITKFLFIFLACSAAPLDGRTAKPFTIMLAPAGDAKHTGRLIDDCFERGLTLQCAEKLKGQLEQKHGGIRVILTRFAGESVERLQNANFANRLDVDLYISIHFYQKQYDRPRLTLYYYCDNPVTDTWHPPAGTLRFTPFDQAHKTHRTTTQTYLEIMQNVLTSSYRTICDVTGPYGIRFAPHLGVQAPAIALEASLVTPQDWHQYIDPISQAISAIIAKAQS